MSGEQAAPPWYRWHWEAFLKAVRGWSFDQRALYRELLDIQWQEGFIPKAEEAARVMTGCSREQWAAAWPIVAPKFPLTSSGSNRRQNPKMAHERARALASYDQARAAGVKSGEARRHHSKNQTLNEGAFKVRSTDLDIDLRSRGKSEKDAQGSLLPLAGEVVGRHKSRAPRTTGKRLPPDFDLDLERRSYAESRQLDADRTFENFSDYWKAASGRNATKRDWDATWRMWCRNEVERSTTRVRGSTKAKVKLKTLADVEAEEAANGKH